VKHPLEEEGKEREKLKARHFGIVIEEETLEDVFKP
jgi:hypothetical protein